MAIFENLIIVVVPTLIGKKRLSLFESQILKESGKVCSMSLVKNNQQKLTHIVVEDSLLKDPSSLERVLRTMGNPQGVIVGTQWLSDSIKLRRCMPTSGYEAVKKLRHEGAASSSDEDDSYPPEKKQKIFSEGTSDSSLAPETVPSDKKIEVNKFVCSQSSSSTNTAVEGNQLIIQELQKLADAFRSRGDTWRSHGYAKAISAIRRCGKVLESYEDAISLPGVGEKMASKVWEILETGSLRKVSEVCKEDKTKALELFTNIWGVGPSTADGWYQQGCRTLDDVMEKVSLSKQQQIGLKYFDDFSQHIPRNEVEEVAQLVSVAAKSIDPLLSITLVGSFRRGKDSCGDIDIMIIKPDHFISKDILSELLRSLKKSGLVTDDLVSMENKGNQRKYLGVCRLPGENRKHRRLDIFVVPKSEEAPALMHYTGSALFNRSIRLLAAKKGMSLSEHGLFAGIVREGLKVLNDGYIIPTASEELIFQALDLEYRPPEERDH